MWRATALILALVVAGPLLEGLGSGRAGLVVYAIRITPVYQLFKPYMREIAYTAESVGYWNTSGNLTDLIEAYFIRACELIKINQLEEASYYLAVVLSLLVDLIPRDFPLNNVNLYLETVREDEIIVLEGSVREILGYASRIHPRNVREFCIVYLSIAVSLINKLPLGAFERLIFTPVLRELFIASIVFTSVLFSILLRRKAKYEGVDVEYEHLP